MSEYIKVDDVRDHLLRLANDFEKNDQYYPEKHLKEKAKTLRMLSEKFYDYPGNVEVVRCKDCIYHGKRNDKECCTRLEVAFPIMYGDDFCSYGERKETE